MLDIINYDMSFRFKNKEIIINYFENEMGLNKPKINKIIEDIEKIENNNITNVKTNENQCYFCRTNYRLKECKYCDKNICAECYTICAECKNIICDKCIKSKCPICYDKCDLCSNYKQNLIQRSIIGSDDSTYYYDICEGCNDLKNIKEKLSHLCNSY